MSFVIAAVSAAAGAGIASGASGSTRRSAPGPRREEPLPTSAPRPASDDIAQGFLAGVVMAEVLHSHSPSPAPADPPSFDSGGGGDFGGGGASGDF